MTSAEPHALLGGSPAMERLRVLAARVAAAGRATVLVEGPPGAGKSHLARAIHAASPRSRGPLVELPCAGWSLPRLEQELFGSGGEAAGGLWARARGGTLVLDGIGELPAELQGTLLRILESVDLPRPGDAADADRARVVATTRHDLQALVEADRFREDLHARLNVLRLTVPPLAERPEDIDVLARAFVAGASGGRCQLSSAALARLRAAPWPGNARALEAAVRRAVIAAGEGLVRVEHLDLSVPPSPPPEPPAPAPSTGERTLRAVEEAWIRRVLAECGGNRSRCARVLGIHRATLHAKLRLYGIAADSEVFAR